MKKTYIEPETTVVAINVKSNLMDPSAVVNRDTSAVNDTGVGDVSGTTLSRETVSSPDAWEEW